MRDPYIIVLGNEKGGTGKSTVSMHLIVALLRKGCDVGSIDIDARQGTLSRYIENRNLRKATTGQDLPTPDHEPLFKSELPNKEDAEADERERFDACLRSFHNKDFIVIDTPGNDTYLSRLAHAHADALITPLNDSFIDLDMLVRVSGENYDILKPSTYAEMVWEQKKQKAIRNGGSIDWIVLRNRLSSINSRNKEEITRIMNALSKRIGFRTLPGFGERVIFRELFLTGMTLLDMRENGLDMSLSHIAAKNELASLLSMIHLPKKAEHTNHTKQAVA